MTKKKHKTCNELVVICSTIKAKLEIMVRIICIIAQSISILFFNILLFLFGEVSTFFLKSNWYSLVQQASYCFKVYQGQSHIRSFLIITIVLTGLQEFYKSECVCFIHVTIKHTCPSSERKERLERKTRKKP